MKHCCVGIEHSVVMEDGKEVEEFAGVVKSPRSQSEWLARKHETLEINRQDLGLSPKKKTRHATTKFGSIAAKPVRLWLNDPGEPRHRERDLFSSASQQEQELEPR